MTQDEAFVAGVLAQPGDLDLRLIYADWLEDHGDPRAEYLRWYVRLLRTPDAGQRTQAQARLRQMRRRFDPAWVLAIECGPVENCPEPAGGTCPGRWERMPPGEEPAVRFCGGCRRPVYHCETVDLGLEHRARGHRIVVDSTQPRSPGDIPTRPFLGTTSSRWGRIPTMPSLPRGTLVRVRRGPLAGQLAVVVKVRHRGQDVRIRLVGTDEFAQVPVDNVEEVVVHPDHAGEVPAEPSPVASDDFFGEDEWW